MMMKILTLLAFLAVATALPSSSSIVPERDVVDTTLLEVNAFDEAKAAVESMIQAGKDEGACADLAAASIKEVEDAVDSNQKILDSLDTGADCPNKGQSAVDAAQSALDNAQNEKQSADAAAAAAASASVNFGSVPLSSLAPGQCDVFFNGAAYTSAVATKESTANAAIQAGAAVTAAEAGLKAAQEAQQDAIAECQCAAKKAYEAAWEAANANSDANDKAYTKGKHMQCVLEGTPPASCTVGAIPKVQAITMADGVLSAVCDAPQEEPAPPPAPAPQALVAGSGAGSSCAMHDKHNNQGSITGTGCGGGYHGCHVKANSWAKIANSGGCCSGGGFHRRCHCSTNANVDCQAMCQKDSGCIGWVTANHGCQWATISSGC